MTTYTPEALRDSLEVALEDRLGGKSLAEFYCGGRSSSQSRGQAPERGWSGDHWTPDMPNAERELQRDLDALKHISADCPRDRWRSILVAIADRHLGSDLGREIALAWSLGGTVSGVTFPKPTGDFTLADFEACWRDACRNPHFGIGTVSTLQRKTAGTAHAGTGVWVVRNDPASHCLPRLCRCSRRAWLCHDRSQTWRGWHGSIKS